MAFSIISDAATIGTAIYSLPADTTTGVPTSQTDDCLLQTWIDFGAMTAADEYEWRVYEKISAGTQRIIATNRVVGAQGSPVILPSYILGDGWDVTVAKIAGTDRSIAWSLRKMTGGITFVDDFATISTSEYSLPADTTSGVPTSQTDDCVLQAWIDPMAMAIADAFRWRVYEKVNAGTQRAVYDCNIKGTQALPLVIPMMVMAEGWDVTLLRTAGADASMRWSLRKLIP